VLFRWGGALVTYHAITLGVVWGKWNNNNSIFNS
jgi:hypothetical protein